ncbi:MAG: RnfABCDGE type electron transport complex subunit D [Lachnospiraceae bacterium]|nr:RnfABCDGE type electron transport complex subunit D [Lachnospiraceae bacterium]
MNQMLNVSSSPHARCKTTTRSIMYDVIIALLPATLFGVYRFGFYALIMVLVTTLAAVLTEYVYEVGTKRRVTILDGSAAVTGLLLALNMPPGIPLWIPVVGSVFAILVVKQLFGGLGQNFMNPALAARCFLLISFTGRMNDFVVDGISGATPLALLKSGENVDLSAMLWGFTGGTIGEVSTLAILLGAVYLLVRRVISWLIPVTYIVSFAVCVVLLGGHGLDMTFLLGHLLGGGLMLGAWFMASDYVTSPITRNGKILFGILLGVLTCIFRLFGGSAGGVSYAIILCNLLVPLIEKVTMPKAFGWEGKQS